MRTLNEHAILLSPQARANAIPRLEVLENEVKAGHGATVGKIGEEELFYLATRGLPKDEAKALIVRGFLEAFVDEFPPNKQWISAHDWQEYEEPSNDQKTISFAAKALAPPTAGQARLFRQRRDHAEARVRPLRDGHVLPFTQRARTPRRLRARRKRDRRVRERARRRARVSECRAPRRNYFHGRDDGRDKYDSARLCGVAEARGHHPALRHGTPRDDSPVASRRAPLGGLKVHFVPLTTDGRIDMGVFKKALTKYRPKFVGVTHISNVLGTINPVAEMIAAAHKAGAVVLVDAAQSVAHIPVDVQKLDCDFLVFSGHKMYGPTGVGILYGKKSLLEALPPFIYGGHMIEQVTREKTTYAPLPEKFEGGTQPVAEVIGLGAALAFVQRIGFAAIQKHERALVAAMLKGLKSISGLTLLGSTKSAGRIPVFSFTLKGLHPHDLATLLDRHGVAVRAGHHCAEILHSTLTPDASLRMSLGVYNTVAEIGRAIAALRAIQKKWRI